MSPLIKDPVLSDEERKKLALLLVHGLGCHRDKKARSKTKIRYKDNSSGKKGMDEGTSS